MGVSDQLRRFQDAERTWQPLVEDALSPLTMFCRTATDVALYLEAAGVRGTPGHGWFDPLAQYLHDTVPEPEFFVYHTDVTVNCPGGGRLRIQLAPHVASFVRKFDAGEYPYLDVVKVGYPETPKSGTTR